MLIFPAVDLFDHKAVRLYKGDYEKMTVYSSDPPKVGEDFAGLGATHMHVVDLQGARDGDTPNFDTVTEIKRRSGLFCEVGGGIRTMDVVERYLNAGIDRVILGTAAITDEDFLKKAVDRYHEKIAVGADIRDGFIAVKGWTEKSSVSVCEFFEKMEDIGVRTVICTDISRDGAMQGTNLALYKELSKKYKVDLTASGGISSLDDIRELSKLGLYGAIVGKAYYTGDIDLRKAVEEAR